MLFGLLGLGGSYTILKARAVAEKRRNEALAGEYHVRPERSGTEQQRGCDSSDG